MNRTLSATLLWLALAAPAFGQAAMIYGTDATSTPDAVSLPQPTERYFTQGNGTSILGTQVPSYWVNKVGGELSAAIQTGCGETLAMTAFNQLATCITGQHGRLLAIRYFPAGTYTNTPTAGTSFEIVEVQGGGGAGGGAPATGAGQYSQGGGGTSGSYSLKLIASGFSGATITVGAGGTGNAGGWGNNGGITTFASSGGTQSVAGGNGGETAGPTSATTFQVTTPAYPTIPTGGDINIAGWVPPTQFTVNGMPVVGTVALSHFGPAYGAGGLSSNANGPSSAAKTGYAGQDGICIVADFN